MQRKHVGNPYSVGIYISVIFMEILLALAIEIKNEHTTQSSNTILLFIYLFIVHSWSIFPPTTTSPPHPSPPLTLNPTPFGFVHVSLIYIPDNPSPFSLHYPSPQPPLLTVSLVFISMCLVIFCLLLCFVDYGMLIGKIRWYLSFTT